MRRSLAAVSVLAAVAVLSVPVFAQTVGGAVPPADPAPAAVVQPYRAGTTPDNYEPKAPTRNRLRGDDPALVARFAELYAKKGKPKLAIFWNRELTDQLDEWYSNTRMVVSRQGDLSVSGDVNIAATTSGQTVMERQVRAPQPARGKGAERTVWMLQDGFLQPFMRSKAAIYDRAAVVRLMGSERKGSPIGGTNALTLEMQALKGSVDILVELLATDSPPSTIGEEFRAQLIDIRTGQLLGFVNSRHLPGWEDHESRYVATGSGYVLDDEERFGPEGDRKWRAGPDGYRERSKPPKYEAIGRSLAYGVMESLIAQWQ
jgi:hypothetical protein